MGRASIAPGYTPCTVSGRCPVPRCRRKFRIVHPAASGWVHSLHCVSSPNKTRCAAVGSSAALRMRRTPCGCFRRAFLSNDPRRVSALWGSLAVVDVGVDGDVPQMFVLHIFHLLFSMKGPRGARRAADQHTRPPCRPSDSGRRSRFAHSFALYAVLSIFASCFQGLFQKNRTIPQFS